MLVAKSVFERGAGYCLRWGLGGGTGWLIEVAAVGWVMERRDVSEGYRRKKPRAPRLIGGGVNILLWRRPTFAGPIAPLSSAQQRFTSVFGMGTGGATVPWSPDQNPWLR